MVKPVIWIVLSFPQEFGKKLVSFRKHKILLLDGRDFLGNRYLHVDGDWHETAGIEGSWGSKEAAEKAARLARKESSK